MRYRTLEIRWHDSKPILSCDFQPVPFKKARPTQDRNFATQSYRLATAGEDNHVRLWMVHPNIMPTSLAEDGEKITPRPARVEYLATLSRHSAAVNVVRFSPNGDLIASAGDDGMIIVWAPTSSPPTATYGSDLTADDMVYEKEYWKPRLTLSTTRMQVYDLAWSPTGEYIIAGSTDNCARIWSVTDGKCVLEIAEHNHYVQGVAWDPLNEYVATQSSDRSMHIYSISTKNGVFEAHAVGKNTRMAYNHSRTPSSQSRIKLARRESTASDAESSVSDQYNKESKDPGKDDLSSYAPLTPATSVASTPSSMFPPPPLEKPSSRRSSFSGSNAPSSPSHYGRYGRSPSPMPPLPAIRALPSPAWSTIKLYGEENYTNFFRRLTFSPDGGLLMTPAGQFEDPSVAAGASKTQAVNEDESTTPTRGRKTRPSINTKDAGKETPSSTSSVYIYTRANFARPPVAQLPGHKKASVAVKFSPMLYELRNEVPGIEAPSQTPKTGTVEKGKEGDVPVNITGPVPPPSLPASALPSPRTEKGPSGAPLAAPAPQHVPPESTLLQSPTHALKTPTPLTSAPPTPALIAAAGTSSGASSSGSVFALPYRMLYAVLTNDTVTIYDTQQSGPVCMLTKLHYDEFTDATWSPDGQCLMISSRDGYCTIVIFDEILPTHHTQQQALQMQSIAHHNSVPLTYTPSSQTTGLPSSTSSHAPTPSSSSVPLKRSEPSTPLQTAEDAPTPAPPASGPGSSNKREEAVDKKEEPPKKKRRVALTRVGDLANS
ncbi:WD40 repeat-like protein [Coniophora puteana RWD-64-598 SS2]|uniref:WD40 repeat-like protein n=1 Tax=Coniophora puteana (strain RWD-64-598) TaxID=741705 RepID=A0A5M3MKS4_CONPW|nr:WD40 repeat-like protein [Coniophora puteana RWD-64-598 SS2]EIW79627.1 WD40 repeat-like protein [Coniophora puteana RWD-64-598 SS2]